MGSVKDLDLREPAYENRSGRGRFHFSERYSIFDYGEMPDHIIGKGASLAVMAASNFEMLGRVGIPHHYRGLVVNNQVVGFSDLKEGSKGSSVMEVEMAMKYPPIARKTLGDGGNPIVSYDYSFYETNRGKLNNFLVPLEIIFRNGLPEGSSVFGKINRAKQEADSVKRADKLNVIFRGLGVTSEPQEGDMLPRPVMNYTTKLEEGDRSLREDEAYWISGLTEAEFRKIGPLALEVNDLVNERASQTGLSPHWDGKVEMRYFNGFGLVDVFGTLDEDRMGDRVSKEFLRQWYDDNQPEFHKACDEWKKTGEGWQERCPVKPVRLPRELSTLVSEMYMSAANQWVGRKIFPGVPQLDKVLEGLKPFRG